MPSWLTLELILGIVGTLTGILGLVIHLTRIMRERPQLKVEIVRCQHHVATYKTGGQSKKVGTLIEVEMRVHNRGDWDTTLNDAQILIKDYRSGKEKLKTGGIEVPGHTTRVLEHSFSVPGIEISDSSADCVFILYHTHGKQRVTAVSNLRGA